MPPPEERPQQAGGKAEGNQPQQEGESGRDRKLTERLCKVGFKVSQHRVWEHDNKGGLHMIWLAERGP